MPRRATELVRSRTAACSNHPRAASVFPSARAARAFRRQSACESAGWTTGGGGDVNMPTDAAGPAHQEKSCAVIGRGDVCPCIILTAGEHVTTGRGEGFKSKL